MKTIKQYPTQEYLKKILDYDPETGIFTWKKRETANPRTAGWNAVHAGKKVRGYRGATSVRIDVDDSHYMAHRLAWIFVNGDDWDRGLEIDHKDCDFTNNRISNLRLATRGQNMANSRKFKRKTLPKGVHKNANCRTYYAVIHVDKQRHYLGCFDSAEEAKYFYDYAAQYYRRQFARTG